MTIYVNYAHEIRDNTHGLLHVKIKLFVRPYRQFYSMFYYNCLNLGGLFIVAVKRKVNAQTEPNQNIQSK